MNEAMPDNIPVKKSEHVRAMFGAIAQRYDFLNHFLSLNIDQRWRRVTVEQIVRKLGRADFNALDLACGTGDLTAALRRVTSGRVVGMDFCHPMLVIGLEKCFKSDPPAEISLAEADALQLPVRDNSFDAVSIAFGLRNLEDYREGLREMSRVLRPGGVLAVLEFSQPELPVFRHLYQFYFTRVLPWLGTWFSGVAGPYAYLPDSVSKFPNQEALKALMESVGFSNVEYSNLTGGVAALHLGTK
jgi:demethylmenaquinone methyltransferase/2-methoxy-6-polyprenyl-1,4-benzoquinol methylase